MNKVVKANQGAYQTCSRQTVADAGATARRAIAITRNGLEAAKGVHVRVLKQRDASRAEAAEAKSSLEAVRMSMPRHALLPISLSGFFKTVGVLILLYKNVYTFRTE